MLTLWGHLLLAKVVLSMLMPSIGLRSLRMAGHGDTGFRVGGIVLVALGLMCIALRWAA